MKKLVSIILAVMLVSALAVTSFAAPTVDYVFNDSGKTYIFGSVDNTVTDMGIEFSDKDGRKHTALFSELGASEIADVNYSFKYGYEIVSNGKLSETFAVKPFYKVGENPVNGAVYTVNPEEKTVETVAPGSVVAEFQETLSETSGSNLTSNLPSINGTSRNMFLRFDISEVNVDASEIIFTFGSWRANNTTYSYVSPGADIQLSIYAAEGASENCSAGCNLQAFMNNPANYTHAGAIAKIKENKLGTVTECVEVGEEEDYSIQSVFTLDVTEYVKAQKAKGATKLSIMIDADTIGGQSYITKIADSDTYSSSVPKLSWK